jgi:hypothetical protein
MSWVSGIHERLASSSRACTPWAMASILVGEIPVREDHALGLAGGSRGELDERDVVGGRTMLEARHRHVGDFVEEHRAALEARDAIREPVLVGERAQAIEHLALRGEGRRGQAREHAKELGLVLVGIAGGERDRDDPAEHAGPERVDIGGQGVGQDHRVRARARARRLQMVQESERAPAHLRVRHAALAAFTGDVVNPAGAGRQTVERVGQGGGRGHAVFSDRTLSGASSRACGQTGACEG